MKEKLGKEAYEKFLAHLEYGMQKSDIEAIERRRK
jgi:hypothetical protein